jgi:hypothetical protein
MARSSPGATTLLDLPLEVSTVVCQQLALHDLVCVAATCKLFSYGDGWLETELPTESLVASVLREHAFPGGELIPSMRPLGCIESWVAYLARCARQRRCREAPPLAAGSTLHAESTWSLFVDAAGQLLACGSGDKAGHGDKDSEFLDPIPVAVLAGVPFAKRGGRRTPQSSPELGGPGLLMGRQRWRTAWPRRLG